MSNTACRCGFNGEGEHPCHRCLNKGGEIRSGKRVFISYPASLAGMQVKTAAYTTFACEPCLAEYEAYIRQVELASSGSFSGRASVASTGTSTVYPGGVALDVNLGGLSKWNIEDLEKVD